MLSDEERTYNKKHSKLRIIVEHTICRLKKFGIIGSRFRNRLRKYDHASDILYQVYSTSESCNLIEFHYKNVVKDQDQRDDFS